MTLRNPLICSPSSPCEAFQGQEGTAAEGMDVWPCNDGHHQYRVCLCLQGEGVLGVPMSQGSALSCPTSCHGDATGSGIPFVVAVLGDTTFTSAVPCTCKQLAPY